MNDLIPNLFRTEYSKITAVLCKQFGIAHIQTAEDIASDTFLQAAETWALKGLPPNPVAWLYTVAKNKTKDLLKHNAVFNQKVAPAIQLAENGVGSVETDLSERNITDSQLQMLFAVCHPSISPESQIGLALRILCGFGINEIANAFLSNKETIAKRLQRAKEKLREENVPIGFPGEAEIPARLEAVLTTLYLLFNEGYYSAANDTKIRKELCIEAIRLTRLLIDNKPTDLPKVNALLSLMCFQSSRFEARTLANGDSILYYDQDTSLWNEELIGKGIHYLTIASDEYTLSKYHLEAAIAYWHTIKENKPEKWETILQLYNKLLVVEYSPIAALNRTYALANANGKEEAIKEAEKLNLAGNHLYHSLLGELYTGIDDRKAIRHLETAVSLSLSPADKKLIQNKLLKMVK